MQLADDGFGNLIEQSKPDMGNTRVYCRLDGVVASFVVGTSDHEAAMNEVRRSAQIRAGAVLALIK